MKITDRQIHLKQIFNCSLDTAWWKWTTHEGLLTFFGKDNKVNMIAGGEFEIYFLMDNPPGLRGSEGCKVLSVIPQRSISFTWNAPPEFPEVRNSSHFTRVIIYFNAVDNSQTEIEMKHLDWPEGENWKQVYDYFTKAWPVVFKWFDESLDERSS